jgi:hypothetical protein
MKKFYSTATLQKAKQWAILFLRKESLALAGQKFEWASKPVCRRCKSIIYRPKKTRLVTNNIISF